MYIAHQCLLLGDEYFHLKSKTADGQPITFVDFVPVFRNQAAHLLKSQLDTQRDTLTSFIREIGGSTSFFAGTSLDVLFFLSISFPQHRRRRSERRHSQTRHRSIHCSRGESLTPLAIHLLTLRLLQSDR